MLRNAALWTAVWQYSFSGGDFPVGLKEVMFLTYGNNSNLLQLGNKRNRSKDIENQEYKKWMNNSFRRTRKYLRINIKLY